MDTIDDYESGDEDLVGAQRDSLVMITHGVETLDRDVRAGTASMTDLPPSPTAPRPAARHDISRVATGARFSDPEPDMQLSKDAMVADINPGAQLAIDHLLDAIAGFQPGDDDLVPYHVFRNSITLFSLFRTTCAVGL